ncbi:MAG: sugar phosphate isomerase/epimerase, partial [Candidatus Promineifilaceae bacterium]
MTQLLPISVQLYTVRENLVTDWEGTLEQIAEMGYVGVEMAGFAYAPIKEKVIGKIKELGLEISSAHFELPIGEVQNDIIDSMHAMGNDKLICAWVSPDNFKSIDSIKALVEKFNISNGVAKSAGLQFGFHNHWFEFWNVDGRSGLQVMIDE